MNTFFLHIASIFLAIQMVVGSIGIPLIQHYCSMSGMRSVSVLEKKSCCCALSATKLQKLAQQEGINLDNSDNDDCCDTQISYEAADFDAIPYQKVNFDFDKVTAVLPSFSFFGFTQKNTFSAKLILHFADLPPPLLKGQFGKMRLVFIQVFRW